MKVGVVGLGYWGPNIIRNLVSLGGVEIYAYDIRNDRIHKMKQLYPSVNFVESIESLINESEVVMVVTPLETHYRLAKIALASGKDVFVEKPLANSSKEALELIDLAKKWDRILMVGHTFLFNPAVRKIKELIDNGDIGNIYYISMTRINLGIHRKDCNVIWDLASHDLSILNYWLNEDIVKINAIGDVYTTENGNVEVAFINLKFSNGTIANIHVSWIAPTKVRYSVIVGSRKMIVYDETNQNEKIKIFDAGVDLVKEPHTYGEYLLTYRTGDIVSPVLPNVEPLKLEIIHFLDCVKNRKKPISNGYEGLKVVKLLELIDQNMSL